MLPGVAADGTRLCTNCAGIHDDFTCVECGAQGRRWQRRCARCTLTARLRHILDDGTGNIRGELIPLFDGLRQMERPASGLNWLGPPYVGDMLSGLARGDIPLTHEALNTLPHPRAVTYLRDLLMQYEILPRTDRQLLLFSRWLDHHLATITDTDTDQRCQIEQFATWHVHRRLRAHAERGRVTPGPSNAARSQIIQATHFLTWLHAHGRTLTTTTQADLDAWHAGRPATVLPSHTFLRWCMNSGRPPPLTIHTPILTRPSPISQSHQVALIHRMLTDETTALRTRILALLVLLYAQPLVRIVELTTDDIIHTDGIALRLGDPPAPVPAPFAELLTHYLATRPNMRTAANPTTRWLFPGRRPGEPITTATVRELLTRADVPPQASRTAALRHLVQQAPAPVIADMLSYDHQTTSNHATHAGAPWSRYAHHDQ